MLAYLRPSLVPRTIKADAGWKEKILSLPNLWPFIVVIVVVIGGIYLGVFTVTEAAAVGNFILLAIFLLTSKFSRNTLRVIEKVVIETASLTVVIFSIFYFAQIFTRFMVVSGISEVLVHFVIGLNLSPIQIVIAATVLYLVLGCFIDSISIIMVTVPLFLPIMKNTGIDPIWYGMVLILATQVGLITPPVGINLYTVKSIAGPDTALGDIVRGALPFLIASLIALAIVMAVPGISTWIPYHYTMR